MANIENISGWREERIAFTATDEGKQFFNETLYRPDGSQGRKPSPKINLSTIFFIITQITKDKHLNQKLAEYCIYQKQVDDADHVQATEEDFAHLTMPAEARETLVDFYKWHAMKENIGYSRNIFGLIISTAYRVFIKDYPSFYSHETIETIRQQNIKFLIIDIEGTGI